METGHDTSMILATRLRDVFCESGMKLVLAESCTGGLLGHLITEVPGSSDFFLGAIIAYSYEAKQRLLDVKKDTLLSYGAVSKETALEMARGVRAVFASDHPFERLIGVSITGIAGPGGGMPDKPVGLVWIGISSARGDFAWQAIWQHDRSGNKLASAQAAVKLLLALIRGDFPEEIP